MSIIHVTIATVHDTFSLFYYFKVAFLITCLLDTVRMISIIVICSPLYFISFVYFHEKYRMSE